MTKHQYNFGLIGNCSYQALVDDTASIVWLCWPRFDSSFIFGELLDSKKGGKFQIEPEGLIKSNKQYYLDNTNILCTEIECDDGAFRVTDFAPRFIQYDRYYRPLMLIRKLEPLSGNPIIKVKCHPVGNYGDTIPRTTEGSNHLQFLGLERDLRLTTNISLSYLLTGQSVVLNEVKYLILTFGPPMESSIKEIADTFLDKTILYWRRWVKNMSLNGFHQSEVIRSALTLKIHQYEDTGAITAATTTSLPESPESGRNWDYRYCWMRDTYYTLTAFNHIGHFEELEKYFHFISNISKDPTQRYQPLYSISGESYIAEKILNLDGYLGNQPVRRGNHAYTHTQNDVYGQILVSLMPLFVDKRFIDKERTGSLSIILKIMKEIENRMDEPDAGIWEFRDKEQFHCYTYLFHWAGSLAALKIAKTYQQPELESKALQLCKLASAKIEQCFDNDRGVYTQAIGNNNLDASNLQLILMHYLDPRSKKARTHLKVLEQGLKSKNGLFFRYKHEDDFGKPESTFLVCGFWYAEALACVGRVKDAIETFEYLIEFGNHLGLFSEDINPETGSQWGNFPQTYSHVGLVNAAYRIDKKLDHPNFANSQTWL